MGTFPCSEEHQLLFREFLTRVGDKWSLAVVYRLGKGPLRFSELMRAVDGISERMLTVTVRALERDGLLSRTVFAVVPPRVEYQLTDMGLSLLGTVGELFRWTSEHVETIIDARAEYEASKGDDGVRPLARAVRYE